MTTHANGSNPLNQRQTELLAFVASGLTIGEAAARCHIAEQSAYNTLSVGRGKAGATTVTQLAVMAITHGWLKPTGQEQYAPADQLQAVS